MMTHMDGRSGGDKKRFVAIDFACNRLSWYKQPASNMELSRCSSMLNSGEMRLHPVPSGRPARANVSKEIGRPSGPASPARIKSAAELAVLDVGEISKIANVVKLKSAA